MILDLKQPLAPFVIWSLLEITCWYLRKKISSAIIDHLLISYATDLNTQPSSEQLKAIKVKLDALKTATSTDRINRVLNAVKSITLNTSELLIVLKKAALVKFLKATEKQLKTKC